MDRLKATLSRKSTDAIDKVSSRAGPGIVDSDQCPTNAGAVFALADAKTTAHCTPAGRPQQPEAVQEQRCRRCVAWGQRGGGQHNRGCPTPLT